MKELNEKDEMDLIGLIDNLKTHKMERKAKEEMTPQKKKTIAFKSTPAISDVKKKKMMMKNYLSL